MLKIKETDDHYRVSGLQTKGLLVLHIKNTYVILFIKKCVARAMTQWQKIYLEYVRS